MKIIVQQFRARLKIQRCADCLKKPKRAFDNLNAFRFQRQFLGCMLKVFPICLMTLSPISRKVWQRRHVEPNVIMRSMYFLQVIQKSCNLFTELFLLRPGSLRIGMDKVITRQEGQEDIVDKLCFLLEFAGVDDFRYVMERSDPLEFLLFERHGRF